MHLEKTSRLSDKQRTLLQYLQQRDAAGLPPPTLREICKEVHISSASLVDFHLGALVRAGYVRRLVGASGRTASRGIILNRQANGKELADELLRARVAELEAELEQAGQASEPAAAALQARLEDLEAQNRTLLTTVRVNKVQIAALQRENRALIRALAELRKESEP